MSNQNPQYIYDDTEESYAGPVLMGREREYFNRRKEAVKDFIEFQKNADVDSENKKKVDTAPQLFGISNQNHNQRISLDEKFPGDVLYKIVADNMHPYISPNSYVLLKFSEQHASGEICVYRYRGQTYCNQIKVVDKKIIAISLNPKYKPIILDPDEYYFIAVVSSIHRSLKGS